MLGIESLAHTNLADCYQCGKCTAGCPVSARMDVMPNRLMRLVQLGQDDTALHSAAIWECVSCQTCSARCPKNVDCAGVMDALRETSLVQNKVAASAQTVVDFQKAFLENVRKNGRLNEVQLTADFKKKVFFRTGSFSALMKDAGLAPQLNKRKKLHLISEKAQDRKVVGRIFGRCMEQAQ